MRIARILTRPNLGGPARQVLASDPLLAARGHELRLFTGSSDPGEGDLGEELRAAGVEPVRVPGLARRPSPLADARAGRFLQREFRTFAPDVVHTHASKAGWIGRRAAERACPDAARVHTFHGHVLEGYFPAFASRRLIAAERKLAARTDRVLAVSEATRDDLVRLGVAAFEDVRICRPGTRLEALLALPDAPVRGALRRERGAEDAVVIGVLGRLAPVKRPTLALRAFEALARRVPNARLWYAGDGEGAARELDRAIEALEPSVAGRVARLGNVTDVSGFLGEVDVVLQTSSNEGYPVALVEAGAAARPFVATGVGGVPELVRDGRGGVAVDPRLEVATLAERLVDELERLVRNANERRGLGRSAREFVAREHSAAALADRLEAVYDEAVRRRARRSA